ncbi:TPA: VirK family protein [Enterobacter ludwigii]
MNKSAISFVLLIAITSTGTAFAMDGNTSLQDYDAIKEALLSGHTVTVVTDFSKCKGSPETNMTGGTSINSFLVLADPKTKSEHIAFSDYHQRLDDRNATPQIDFIRYHITTDNNVSVMMSMYPVADKTSGSPRNYKCPLNTSSKFFRH